MCFLGPVGLYTSNHALDPRERADGACRARPITLATTFDRWQRHGPLGAAIGFG